MADWLLFCVQGVVPIFDCERGGSCYTVKGHLDTVYKTKGFFFRERAREKKETPRMGFTWTAFLDFPEACFFFRYTQVGSPNIDWGLSSQNIPTTTLSTRATDQKYDNLPPKKRSYAFTYTSEKLF